MFYEPLAKNGGTTIPLGPVGAGYDDCRCVGRFAAKHSYVTGKLLAVLYGLVVAAIGE